jgi:cation diffusion facilitator family transporter
MSKDQQSSQQIALRTTYFSILGNVAFAFVKWTAGILGNSYALIADAIESTSDIFASFLVFLGIKYTNRPADSNHPYGHGRLEPLITFIVVAVLMTSATIIAYESIVNIRTPHAPPKLFTLLVLAPIIIWKELSFQWVMHKAKLTNSSALKSDAWHHRSDAITSVAAFIGISIALFMGKGYEAADDWAALFASGFILFNCYKIFRPALGEIMDEHQYEDVITEVRKIALTVNGVVATEKCFIRKSGMYYLVDLHLTVDGNITVKEGHSISHQVQDTLKEQLPHLASVLIHVEPSEKVST